MELSDIKDNIEKIPSIKIVWEDLPENITEEKIKRVKKYFQHKYNTNKIIVQPKIIVDRTKVKLESIDVTENILDKQYQKKLMSDYIKENDINIDIDMINRLDDKINKKINISDQIKYSKWTIKKLEFSNILSFGDNNVINFENFNGITLIESDPPNFGGKTTASVDLLLFLFFGVTTKTRTNIEIFNRFRYNVDDVVVKGYIEIDNEEYLIVRKLTRRKKRNIDEYTVKSILNFSKKLSNGEYKNLNDEQRNQTEKVIRNAIGTQEDFLTTILTTGYNLEQLIESKPTQRGQILLKFLGLEIFREKEKAAREDYNEWSRSLLSNTNDLTTLISNNEEYKTNIIDCENLINSLNTNILNKKEELEKQKEKNYKLLSNYNKDIDDELLKINPIFLKREISDLEDEKNKLLEKNTDVVEPSEFYVEDDHNELKEKITQLQINISQIDIKINDLEEKIKQFENGSVCPTCNRPFENVDYSDEINKIKIKIKLEKNEKEKIKKELEKTNIKEKHYKKLKEELDLYEKKKLIKSRTELEIEQKSIEINKKREKIEYYSSNKEKMEENQKIDGEILSLKTNIETLEAEIRNDELKIETNKGNVKNYKEKIKVNEKIIKKIRSEERIKPIYKIYLDIFGKNGISKVIVRNMIPLLNEELHRILSETAPFIVELNINSKNELEFFIIDNETRVIKPLSSGSGYEKTISSFAIRSIITKVSPLPKPNIIVMDEVFGKIANDNLDLVGNFFIKIKDYFNHIFVISHNELIRNWSDNLIMVNKNNNISTIKEIKTKINN